MSFQIKKFSDIALSMMNYARATQNKLTDFTVGSAVRTILECAAIEMDEMYQQMWLGLKEAIPVAVYNAFGFNRLPATSAQGQITVTITTGPAFTITAGTVFTSMVSATIVYRSTADIAVGSTDTVLTVPVQCISSGPTTPVPSGMAFSAGVLRLVSAVAAHDFANGTNVEADSSLKARFIDYVDNLARSTDHALATGAKTTVLYSLDGTVAERVVFAIVDDVIISGVVQANCYIHNGADGASGDLVTECDKILRGYTDDSGNKIVGWKAAGVKLLVIAGSNVSVDVTAIATTDSTVDHTATLVIIGDTLDAYFNTLGMGDTVVMAELISAAMAVDGVTNFVISDPTGDVTATAYEKPIKGAYALT